MLVAASFACVRITPLNGLPLDVMFWLGWLFAVLCIVGVSSVSLIPATLFVLRSGTTSAGIGWLAGYALAWTVAAWIFIGVVTGGRVPEEVYFVFGFAVWSYTIAIAVPLLIVRGRGYRLTFPRERRRAAAATLAAESATGIPPAGGGHRGA